MIVLSRIDNRLVHGQVIEAWLPHLQVQRLVVADAEASRDPLMRAAMGLAIPPEVKMVMGPVSTLDFAAMGKDGVKTLVLFRDVQGALEARSRGLPDGVLNLGNVHSGPGRNALSNSVHLSSEERESLRGLERGGMQVVLQAVPSEAPTRLAN